MANDTPRTLICLIEGDSSLFQVEPTGGMNIMKLKDLIWEKGKNGVLRNVDAKDLTLWKVDLTPPMDGREHLAGKNVPGSVKLEKEFDTISAHWPEATSLLHILVELPSGGVGSFTLPANTSLRSHMVSALYDKLKKYFFMLVRGTPASGKTRLCRLLARHIHQQEPEVHIITVTGSPSQAGFVTWEGYFRGRGWIEGRKTVFIFDEAQLTYGDSDLWNGFFKSLGEYQDRFAIAFASFGSPTTSIDLPNTPFPVMDRQRVTLRSVDHDGLGAVGLLFTRPEFDDLVNLVYPASPEYYFDSSFFDGVFDITGGHAGAITDVVKVVTAHDSYRRLRNGECYTWDLFSANVDLRDLLKGLESGSIFQRGIPSDSILQRRWHGRIFSNVLRHGSILQPGPIEGVEVEVAARVLRECFRNGWLHTDRHIPPQGGEVTAYVFPSPLHRWFVEWKLWRPVLEDSIEADNILQLVVKVIAKFSPLLLSDKRRIGPGYIQRPPEAQYQDEFYRSAYSNGALVTFPEFGTVEGRIDFYIPSKKWGVELLREGDRIAQHSGRFSQSGSYGTTLELSDWIILDCRSTWPKRPHPDIQKLYHAVFSNDYEDVTVLDHLLRTVPGGEMRLLSTHS